MRAALALLLASCSGPDFAQVLATSEVGVGYGGTSVTTASTSRYDAEAVSVHWTVRPFVKKAPPQEVKLAGDIAQAREVISLVREVSSLKAELAGAVQAGKDLQAELIKLRIALGALAR